MIYLFYVFIYFMTEHQWRSQNLVVVGL